MNSVRSSAGGSGIGPVWIIVAGVLWGFSAFTKKILLVYVDPILLNILNSLSVCAAFVMIWIRPRELWNSFKRFPLLYCLMAFFGTTIGTTLLYVAIDSLDLSVASVVGKLQPIFSIVIARIALGERMTAKQLLWSVVAVFGAYLVSIPDPLSLFSTSNTTFWGLLAALVSSLGWAISGVIGRRLTTAPSPPSPGQITFFRYLLGSFFILPLMEPNALASAQIQWSYGIPLIPTIIFLAIVTTAVPTWCFYKGLSTVSAGYASILELSSPLTAVLLGVVFLREDLSITQIMGVVTVIAAILLLENVQREKPT
jgi:drug/metabolite transporter (DMT)-like permease